MALVAPDSGRDPVDEALAPPRPLDHERPFAILGDRPDRLTLALAKGRIGPEHGLDVELEEVFGVDEVSLTEGARLSVRLTCRPLGHLHDLDVGVIEQAKDGVRTTKDRLGDLIGRHIAQHHPEDPRTTAS